MVQVLEGLGLTVDQFIDMCILCGCDYCGHIKGAVLPQCPLNLYSVVSASCQESMSCDDHSLVLQLIATVPGMLMTHGSAGRDAEAIPCDESLLTCGIWSVA